MKAPQINNQSMREVAKDDWEYCTNNLVINVYGRSDESKYRYLITYKGQKINQPLDSMFKTPQECADQAVEFLHSLRNVINYIHLNDKEPELKCKQCHQVMPHHKLDCGERFKPWYKRSYYK